MRRRASLVSSEGAAAYLACQARNATAPHTGDAGRSVTQHRNIPPIQLHSQKTAVDAMLKKYVRAAWTYVATPQTLEHARCDVLQTKHTTAEGPISKQKQHELALDASLRGRALAWMTGLASQPECASQPTVCDGTAACHLTRATPSVWTVHHADAGFSHECTA